MRSGAVVKNKQRRIALTMDNNSLKFLVGGVALGAVLTKLLSKENTGTQVSGKNAAALGVDYIFIPVDLISVGGPQRGGLGFSFDFPLPRACTHTNMQAKSSSSTLVLLEWQRRFGLHWH